MSPELERALNEAAAKLCGYNRVHEREGRLYGYFDKAPEQYWLIPSYCTDRNALPELWKVLQSKTDTHIHSYIRNLIGRENVCSYPENCWGFIWRGVINDPHLHVISILKACDAWTSELEELWEKTKCSSS